MAKYQFPKGFLWGSATSAHQVEGGLLNDWTEWEKENAERLAKEARSYWQKWQQEKFPEMFDPKNYISGQAADHYNRYEEDFDIAKSIGHNAHRFSIEWSRVEPKQGFFDELEIEHYKKVIKALKERGIEPIVTLWHWSNPVWIGDIGDWSNKDTINHYINYVDKITHALKDVKFWIPLNEPNIHTLFAYVKGTQPPGNKSIVKAFFVVRNLLSAHKKAYSLIHKNNKNAQVGTANSVMHLIPKNRIILNRFVVYLVDRIWNVYLFKKINGFNDFLGLNYYTRNALGVGGHKKQDDLKHSDLGWDIFPKGIYIMIMRMKRYFNLPIYITENGIADADDKYRTDFIKEHIYWIHKAISEGADVRGYMYWSLLDNYELPELRGFWPRFGLVEVDFKTQKRTIRRSAFEYAKICKSNELEI